MRKTILSKSVLSLIITLLIFSISCGKKDNPTDVDSGFDKTGMLVNYADNLIIPAYTQMQSELVGLDAAINIFLATPDVNNQQALKVAFRSAFLQYQRVSVFQFGPAESVSLSSFVNMLPANTEKKDGIDKSDLTIVEENIISGTYNLVQNSAFHQQGFPILDYLLFSDNAITKFTASNSANRKKYVQDVIARMKSLVNNVLTNWKDTYRTRFISNTKSDTGSPISFLANQLAFEMDMIKGPRIGWPLGNQSGGVAYPERCEGYYSGLSLDLAVENMINLKKAYTGDGSGKGISDYLISLNKQQLNTTLLNQFDVVIAKLNAIPAPLSASLVNNKVLVQDASKEIQTLLALIKTDMVSALSVQISYVDNDGD